MNTTTTQQIEIIDLKPGMIYRQFPSQDWATAKDISYSFKRGVISGVTVTDVEGGWYSRGSGTLIYIKQDA